MTVAGNLLEQKLSAAGKLESGRKTIYGKEEQTSLLSTSTTGLGSQNLYS